MVVQSKIIAFLDVMTMIDLQLLSRGRIHKRVYVFVIKTATIWKEKDR